MDLSSFLILFLFLILISGIATLVIYSLWSGIPPMPTSPKEKKALFALLPKEITGTIYELGSGWGTLAIPLARRYPNCQVIAIEVSPIPYFFSLLRKFLFGPSNLKILRRNFFSISLNNSSLVVCFLFPGAMEKLALKCKKEMKPGSTIVSNSFALPGWEAKEVRTTENIYQSKMYRYQVGDGN